MSGGREAFIEGQSLLKEKALNTKQDNNTCTECKSAKHKNTEIHKCAKQLLSITAKKQMNVLLVRKVAVKIRAILISN